MSSVLDRLRELATAVAGALPRASELAALGPAEEVEATRVLGEVRAAVSASIALLAADIDRRSARELGTDGLAQQHGFSDGAGLVQDLAGLRRDEAARLIRVGGLLEAARAADPGTGREAESAAPPVRSIESLRAATGGWDAPLAVALRHGWLSAAHADALRTGLGAPRTDAHLSTWREAVLELIGDCWSGRWCPEDLARAAKRLRASLDTAAAAAEAAHRHELRAMKRTVRSTGMVHYDIDLDPESDARFYGPIRQLLSPRFGGPRFTTEPDLAVARELEADSRSNAQLQVDTLLDLIDRAVAADPDELFKTRTPQVMIAITTAELRKAHGGLPGIAWIDGRDEAISASDALRLICTGGFTPALFDETGQAIDLGKDQRYFTARQRRAIAKRDGGCLFPGCTRPPDDCEYHHINPWAEHPSHRKSEVRDGVQLCRRHHKLVHDHRARVERRHANDYWLHWPGKAPVPLQSRAGVQTQLRAELAMAASPGAR